MKTLQDFKYDQKQKISKILYKNGVSITQAKLISELLENSDKTVDEVSNTIFTDIGEILSRYDSKSPQSKEKIRRALLKYFLKAWEKK